MTMHDDDTDRRTGFEPDAADRDPDGGPVDETTGESATGREPVAYPSGQEGFGYETHDAADPIPVSESGTISDTQAGTAVDTDIDTDTDLETGTGRTSEDEQFAAPTDTDTDIDTDRSDDADAVVAGTADADVDNGTDDAVYVRDTDNVRDRWREVQVAFVDDPREAVGGARDLVGEVVEQIVAGINGQVDHVNDSWSGDDADTEKLRVALRGYRDLLDRLLAV